MPVPGGGVSPSFGISKYDAVERFDIVDWIVNLDVRTFCRFLLTRARGSDWQKLGPALAQALLESPIIVPDNQAPNEAPAHTSERAELSHVRDLTIFDYLEAAFDYKHFIEEKGKHVEVLQEIEPAESPPGHVRRRMTAFHAYWAAAERTNYGQSSADDEELLYTPLWRAFDRGDDCQNVAVSINLDATDEQLREDFSMWLKTTRAKQSYYLPPRRISSVDFRRWERYRLLPYLDLMNWSIANAAELPQQVLGLALFPDEYDVQLADRVRKTVAPLARQVAHESFCDALRSQARRELAEAKIKKTVPGKWEYLPLSGLRTGSSDDLT